MHGATRQQRVTELKNPRWFVSARFWILVELRRGCDASTAAAQASTAHAMFLDVEGFGQNSKYGSGNLQSAATPLTSLRVKESCPDP